MIKHIFQCHPIYPTIHARFAYSRFQSVLLTYKSTVIENKTFANVWWEQNICKCLVGTKHLQVFGGNKTFANVWWEQKICKCLVGTKHLQMFGGNKTFANV